MLRHTYNSCINGHPAANNGGTMLRHTYYNYIRGHPAANNGGTMLRHTYNNYITGVAAANIVLVEVTLLANNGATQKMCNLRYLNNVKTYPCYGHRA